MNRHIRTAILFLLSIVLSAALTACGGPEDRVAATLSRLGVTDAVFAEQVSDPGDLRDGCLLYTSDSTQMGYYFDPETHNLTSILNYTLMGGSYFRLAEAFSPSAPMVIPADNREEVLLRYANAILGDARIGELSIDSVQDQGLLQSFSIRECYKDIETGTGMFFSTDADGRVSFCNITVGGVFRRGFFGNYEIAAGSDFIGEEAAIEVARGGLYALELASGAVKCVSCELRAREDTLLYIVTFSFPDQNGHQREYQGWVNACAGTLDWETICK